MGTDKPSKIDVMLKVNVINNATADIKSKVIQTLRLDMHNEFVKLPFSRLFIDCRKLQISSTLQETINDMKISIIVPL